MKTIPPGCALRRMQSVDEQCLQDFFRSYTKGTVSQRYGYHLADISRKRARALIGVNQVRNITLGLIEESGDGPALHAVSRYYPDTCDVADLAIVVREKLRRRGLATLLLWHLAEIARQEGLVYFRAQVLCDNLAMRRFLGRYQPRLRYVPNAGAIEFHLPIKNILGQPESEPHKSLLEFLRSREPASPFIS